MDTDTVEAVDNLRTEFGAFRSEVRELHGDAQRHVDVLFEGLKDDIRMVAEAVVALSFKVDGRL